jgi:hypothetical protein
MLVLCMGGLFGFTALAIDLGMLAVSRTECQNAADIAALVGCRTLNNKPGTVNNDLALAVTNAKKVVTGDPTDLTHYPGNAHLSALFTSGQIQKIEAGQYLYDSTAGKFQVSTWTDVTGSQSATPSSGSWTAIRVTLKVSQPTYFMKVFGINTMPSGAVATAVFRPRDTAFVLDMTGSMSYATQFNGGPSAGLYQSMNPDNLVPSFGHYTSVQSYLISSANTSNSSGEAISRNNYCITTPGGPPVIRNFYFDPANVSNPATPAYPVTVTNGTPSLKNAFHRWSPPESGGNSTNYTPVTYDFTGYNAFHNGTEANPKGPTPAPSSFGTMTDSGTITYVGDRWRRADGSVNKLNTSWATGSTTTKAATTAIELLGYNVSGNNVRGGTGGTTTITTVDKFRDPIWEANGYDLDIVAYRTLKGNLAPLDLGAFGSLLPSADRFVGYSMGPGYWGKTFYIWPPDPRFDATANLTSPDSNKPGFDTGGKAMCDWRRHFFLKSNGTAFDPQGDNDPSTSSTAEGINQVLLKSGSGGSLTVANSTTTWQINYPAVLKWIKAGPQVLPPNLRAGRVLYYSSIPDDVNTGTGTAQQKLDKAFWKNYIDYVIGFNYNSTSNLYGGADSWTAATLSIYTSPLSTWTGPAGTWASNKPYMRYNDSPQRPRLHMWFGPLSMLDFIANAAVNGNSASNNWNPGTCNEAQCWQLKAGMNSVLDDVRNNHPNDYAGLVMFAYPAYQDIRVAMGQNFTALKNALFYPKSLLSAINGGDVQTELRPYTASGTSLTSVAGNEIPNANGATDPNTGLMLAFNLLSPSASLPAQYGTIKGRRGASKVVIFETDGVPNSYSNFTLNKKGYDTYYSGITTGASPGNGDATSMSRAVTVATQICKQMATTNGGGLDSGLSLPNAPARVYPIAFGDLFDPVASPSATFRPTALQFLANIAAAGNTGTSGATTIPSYQIITGSYDTRISTLKDCMQRIFQSGVAVTLVE